VSKSFVCSESSAKSAVQKSYAIVKEQGAWARDAALYGKCIAKRKQSRQIILAKEN
jgi:hypothetical protein